MTPSGHPDDVVTRAVCVGVNDYPIEGADLRGCVNDANAWADLLTGSFDARPDGITMLLDEAATRSAILAAVDDMVAASRRGDVAVFTNSSHGTYVVDRDGDETDHYDEALCPWDVRRAPLVDDVLRRHLDEARAGVHLVVISDSCHSGTGTRGGPPPPDAHPRFLDPVTIGLVPGRRSGPSPSQPARRSRSRAQSTMRELFLAGCRDDQFSYDAKIGRRYHGAMTFHAVRLIKAAGGDLTWAELHQQLGAALAEAGFDQEPRLEGRTRHKHRRVFR